MEEELKAVLSKLMANFEAAKKLQISNVKKEKPYEDGEFENTSHNDPVTGNYIHWENPDLLWVYTTDNEEDYGGSQTQIGINKEGSIFWEYQSHCSCDGYENSHGHTNLMPDGTLENEKKAYQLNQIPAEWDEVVLKNAKEYLKKL